MSQSSPSEMSAKTYGSLPISSGNGTNEVTKILKSDKKDNQLGSVTDGEELSDAELILVDTDFLSAEQALNCLENDTKEGSDHSIVSGRNKEQEGPVVEDNECGKEVTHDHKLSRKYRVMRKMKNVKKFHRRRIEELKDHKPRQVLKVTTLRRKLINMLSG